MDDIIAAMHNKTRNLGCLILAIPLICLFAVLLYQLPPVHERLSWRIDEVRSMIRNLIDPPGQVVFIPKEEVNTIVQATMLAYQASKTPTPSPTITATPSLSKTDTPEPTPVPSLTPTPLPGSVHLQGIIQIYQNYNNCGPATLAMYLTYWSWPPNMKEYTSKGAERTLQNDPAAYLKPEQEDKNVMPYEIADYVNEKTSLRALVRLGGEPDLLKALIAAGYPVMIEKGFEGNNFDGWMGHYEVISGYDETKQRFYVNDSYVGPGIPFPIPYSEIEDNWRAFDYTFILVYPPDQEAKVLEVLGPWADENYSFRYAAQKASDEIYQLSGRDQYFAWYNRGTSLFKLQDYAGAAEAYDEAAKIYPTIPLKKRPWRMLWYQTGPYFAYFYSGRYLDVISLATITIQEAYDSTKPDGPYIEESYYWLGMARLQGGDTNGAIEDFRKILKYLHPDFAPALEELQQLGVEP